MPSRPVGVADAGNADAVAEVDVVERASPDLTTTTTADPGAAGTTLAVTANARFPASGNYKIRVEDEVMRVTGGQGTNSWTVTRGIDGTTAVAHAIGVVVAYVVATQRVSPIDERQITYRGRVATFRTPGRAGAAGQKIWAIHNASGSKVLVDVEKVKVDKTHTVIMAVTQLPPLVRLWKFTAVPTNGTAGTKVPEDSALASNASVTTWQDASGEGASSGTALTITLPANMIMEEEFAPRLITAAGYEPRDVVVFLEDEAAVVTLRPLEGLAMFLDYTVAAANPITDMWSVSARWTEYTLP
jgi:hypothetical protein